VPGVVIRTTLIAGFPGETEADFAELCEFTKEMRFERLGCFAYSQGRTPPPPGWRISWIRM
jgi:ribosomal protein S12 methylthiotransferase